MRRVLRSQSDYRDTVLRNQLTSLVLFESVTTTAPKAKLLEAYANRFFNRVKTADLTAQKLAHQTFLDKNAVKKVFEDVLPRYEKAETTFVRKLSVAPRRGDNAKQAAVMLLKDAKIEEKPAKKEKTPVKTK